MAKPSDLKNAIDRNTKMREMQHMHRLQRDEQRDMRQMEDDRRRTRRHVFNTALSARSTGISALTNVLFWFIIVLFVVNILRIDTGNEPLTFTGFFATMSEMAPLDWSVVLIKVPSDTFIPSWFSKILQFFYDFLWNYVVMGVQWIAQVLQFLFFMLRYFLGV